jgi:plastocyanin
VRRAAAVALALVLLTACNTGDDGTPGPDDVSEAPPTGAEVHITDFQFTPASVTVHGGEVVVFTNDGGTEHTVTGDEDGGPDSGRQEPGETFRYVTDHVDHPTAVKYHCSIHSQMRGTILVQP